MLATSLLQAPKEQKSKEAKALAAANSSKGKKKVRRLMAVPPGPSLARVCWGASPCVLDLEIPAEMVQGQAEGEEQQHGFV